MGLRMAADSALSNYAYPQTNFWFFVENQPSIRALSQHLKTSPGLSLRRDVLIALEQLTNLSPAASVTLVWCPAHVGIEENEAVDEAAKAATADGLAQHLPLSLAAVKQLINAGCRHQVETCPPPLWSSNVSETTTAQSPL